MTDKPRFVVDTNTFVSFALAPKSIPGQAVRHALRRGVLLQSKATARELAVVLKREKFNRYASLGERLVFLKGVSRQSLLVEITESIIACRDPKDDMILELAINGNATCIVSGDRDLLVLNPFRGISILTPASFLGVMLVRERSLKRGQIYFSAADCRWPLGFSNPVEQTLSPVTDGGRLYYARDYPEFEISLSI